MSGTGSSASANKAPGVKSEQWLPPIWLCWLAIAAVLLIPSWPDLAAGRQPEADDYMRMLQVRDWLNGQAWYDTHQYRLNGPAGAEMHWVRIVDLPIAACTVLLRIFLSPALAETAALAIVPLLQLLLVMTLLSAIARVLGAARPVQLLAALLAPAFPLILSNFSPGRVDHHGWQAIAALAIAWAMLKDSWRHAFFAGLMAAALLMISLEGIAVAAIFGGLFAARYWLWGQRQHEAYLIGLAAGILGLFAVFRPITELARAMCDLPSWPHILAFGASAAIAGLARLMPGQDQKSSRLLSMLPIAPVAAAALFIPLGWCVVSPLELDSYMRRLWFENMAESAPLTRQSISIVLMTLWTIVLALAGIWQMRRQNTDPERQRGWHLLALAALGAGAYSILLMRAGLTAQILTVPLAALLVSHWLPRARGITNAPARIVATVLVFGLCTPLLAATAARSWDRKVPMSVLQPPAGLDLSDCQIERLRTLPPATFYTPLDRAPELIARTHHRAIMSGYHRNIVKMEQVVRSFEQPVDQARPVIAASGADYLAICSSSSDLWLAASTGRDSLASRFVAGRPMPVWLEVLPGFESGPLRVYKVRK